MCSIMFLQSLPSTWLRLSSTVYDSLRPQPLLTMLPWNFALRLELQSSDFSSFFKESLSANSYSGFSLVSTCFELWCLLPLRFNQSLQNLRLSFLQSLLCWISSVLQASSHSISLWDQNKNDFQATAFLSTLLAVPSLISLQVNPPVQSCYIKFRSCRFSSWFQVLLTSFQHCLFRNQHNHATLFSSWTSASLFSNASLCWSVSSTLLRRFC
jgi:hypothetical protein